MEGEHSFPEVFAAFPAIRRSARGGWDIPCPVVKNHRRGDQRWSARLFLSPDGSHVRFWCGKGCKWEAACAAVGVPPKLWFTNRGRRTMNANQLPGTAVLPREVCAYPYTDATGAVVYEKVRTEPKGFYHRRKGPGGKGYVYSLAKGWYVWSVNRWVSCPEGTAGAEWMEDCRKVPYRWLETRKRPEHPVLVVEGEKSADLLAKLGFLAICSPDGAGKWPVDFGGYLAKRDVVVFPDNDEPGTLHAAQVVGSAVLYEAKSFRVIRPGNHGYTLPDGGDVYDWLQGIVLPALGELKNQARQYEALKNLVKRFPKMVWEGAK